LFDCFFCGIYSTFIYCSYILAIDGARDQYNHSHQSPLALLYRSFRRRIFFFNPNPSKGPNTCSPHEERACSLIHPHFMKVIATFSLLFLPLISITSKFSYFELKIHAFKNNTITIDLLFIKSFLPFLLPLLLFTRHDSSSHASAYSPPVQSVQSPPLPLALSQST
jgi:hypothetical protein